MNTEAAGDPGFSEATGRLSLFHVKHLSTELFHVKHPG